MPDTSALEHEQRFNDIVAAHLEAVEAGERRDWKQLQERHPDLATEIAEFFREQEDLSSRVEPLRSLVEPAPGWAAVRPGAGLLPDKVELGDYRLVREIGRGGMGIVYEAQQRSLGRRVALKVLPWTATLDRQQLPRFQNEAQAAAGLHHTHIVPIFEVGCADHVHYYAMQLIEGQSLAVLLRQRRRHGGLAGSAADETPSALASDPRPVLGDGSAGTLPTPPSCSEDLAGRPAAGHEAGRWLAGLEAPAYFREVATLGVEAAEALDHAHQRGVLHRDIKPANLLLDKHQHVWITDFGLAKAGGAGELTRTGDVVGTLRYLAPERFSGQSEARGDIYSLGLTLYELLTLQPAFAETHQDALIQQVLRAEPVRPRQLDRRIPRDFETIVLKAIAREPARRYQTATELAEDLRRFLDDKPIRARRASQAEQVWRWARRNPWLAGMAAAILLLLVVVAVGASVAAIRIDAARDEADRSAGEAKLAEKMAADEAEANRQSLVRMLVATGARHLDEGDLLAAFPWLVEALKRDQKDPARVEMHRVRLGAVLRQAPKLVQMWFHDHETHAEFSTDGRRVVTASQLVTATQDGTARVWDVATGKPVTPPLKQRLLGPASFSPDGRHVVTGGGDENEGSAQVWDAQTGKAVTPPLPHDAAVRCVSFSSDGSHLLTATGYKGRGGTARVWEAATGKPVTPPLEHKPAIYSAIFSPDGRRVLTAGRDGTARLWEVATGELVSPQLQHASLVVHAAFSSDGSRIITSSHDRTACVWETTTGRRLLELKHEDWVRNADFSPDGRFVVTASDDNTARVWNTVTGTLAAPPLQHRQRVTRAAFSRDGFRIVTASMDTTVRVWDAATGKALTAPMRHVYGVDQAAFSPDGRHVLTASRDQTVRLWDTSTGELAITRLPDDAGTDWQCLSPDGCSVVTASETDHTVRVWNVETGQPVSVLPHAQKVTDRLFSPDSRLVATCCADETARIWNARTGALVTAPLPHAAAVQHASFSPDGHRLATASADQKVLVWTVNTGQALGPPLPHLGPINWVALSPDGRRVATSSQRAEIWIGHLWDATTGKMLTPFQGHREIVGRVYFSPDGGRVLTGSHDSTAQLWEAATGARVATPLRHGNWVLHAAFSADGRRVVTGSADGTTRVWNAETGQPVTPPMQHGGWVGHMAWVGHVKFSPDSRYVSAVAGIAVQVWDATTGEPISPPLKHGEGLCEPVFSPDCQRLITGIRNTVRVWSLAANDWPLEDLVLLGQLLTGRQIDDTGALVPLEQTDSSLSAQANARENLRRAWETLRTKHPRGFLSSP